jgi:hypothetical protein
MIKTDIARGAGRLTNDASLGREFVSAVSSGERA